MSFRVVKITNRCKLETRLNYLVCITDKETKILLDEISVLIIETQQACITSALISELMNHKIRVVFSDLEHNPQGEIVPYSGSQDSYSKIKSQLSWKDDTKGAVWAQIIRMKIRNQAEILKRKNLTTYYNLLGNYANEVTDGDPDNREGLAARSYFQGLFGLGFNRKEKRDNRNIYLNYGYSIILSEVNRSISVYGYLNLLGIHHRSETNPFNLGCDFVEPIRPFVDLLVADGIPTPETFKSDMISVISQEVSYRGKKTYLENAIKSYVADCLSALNYNDPDNIGELTFLDD